jgi:uncharacterized Tic20 family protein
MFCSSCGSDVQEGAVFCQKCGAKSGATPAAPVTSSADSDKLFVIASHLGGIFFGFIPALIVFLIRKDSPGWVLDNAREALNWQITVLISGVACFILAFLLIGLFLFWILMLTNLIFCIVATVKTSSNQTYRYPFSIRLLK